MAYQDRFWKESRGFFACSFYAGSDMDGMVKLGAGCMRLTRNHKWNGLQKGVEYSHSPVARAALFLSITLSLFVATVLGQANGTVIITVRSESGEPAPQVEVQAGDQVAVTDDPPKATLQLPPPPPPPPPQPYA